MKREMDEETRRRLAECLPFDDDGYAEVTLDCFLQFPEEERPYFFLRALPDELFRKIRAEIKDKGDIGPDAIMEALGGVLVGWKNFRTRTGRVIAFSPEAVKSLDPRWKETLFWKAFSFLSPNAQEREGLE